MNDIWLEIPLISANLNIAKGIMVVAQMRRRR